MNQTLPLSAKALRLLLGLTGLAMVAIGLNTALGGMATLGWQFPSSFAEITDPQSFARHDSNARFFAGVYVAFGAIMAASVLWLPRLRAVVIAFLLAIAVGGLIRLLQPGYSPLTDAELLPSFLAELIYSPAMALWTARSQ